MPSTLQWLRDRTDGELGDLLAARPDLLLPAPANLAALARRMDGAATVRRAVGRLDAFELMVLQGLWLLDDPTQTGRGADPSRPSDAGPAAARGGATDPGSATDPGGSTDPAGADGALRESKDDGPTARQCAEFLGGPATAADVARAAAHLHTLGLIRGSDSGYHLAPAVPDTFGRYPAGLGAPTGLSHDEVTQALAATDAAGLAILRRLAPGPPIGSAPEGSRHAETIAHLVDARLLTAGAQGAVALPREVALALRGRNPLGPAMPDPPRPDLAPVDSVDDTAAGQALAAHRRARTLLEILGIDPAPALKSGGVGIVAVRALAKRLGVETRTVALYLEVLHGAGLIAPAVARSRPRSHRQGEPAAWVPTQAADTFLAGSQPGGWALLAATWLDMRRNPAQVERRDAADKIINALSVQADWRGGPAARRRVLSELRALPPGRAATRGSLADLLAYRSPLQHPTTLATQIDATLNEATELGIVAFDALATAGHSLLDDDIEGAASALEHALPAPVDTVVVQADMTLIAPGRMTAALAAALPQFADAESAGSASVYRISEDSVRRALDAGFTGAALHALLRAHSATAIPQSVTYLIDDVARRHGVLRAGSAESFLHSDDAGLMTQGVTAAMAACIPIRSLASTVAVSPVDLATLVDALRSAGLAPAAEDASGAILDLRPPPRRTRIAVPARVAAAEPAAASREQIDSVVRRMRAGDESRSTVADPGGIIAALRTAAHARSAVWIGYADAEGGTSTRMVEPIVVSGGTMVAFDRLRQAPRTFTIHRISSVAAAER